MNTLTTSSEGFIIVPVTRKVSRQAYEDFNRHNGKSTFIIHGHSLRITSLDIVMFGLNCGLAIFAVVVLVVL